MALESDGEGEFVTLVVTQVDDDVEPRVDHEELIVCTDDIDSWDVSGIVRRKTVKIQAVRSRRVVVADRAGVDDTGFLFLVFFMDFSH